MKSASERTESWRQKLIAEGYRQKAFLLSPEALEGLRILAHKHGDETKAIEAICAAAAKPTTTKRAR